ncbi:MAG: enoyl-CoA hydratase [Deltaproteobacteria bacterium]|nr:enoyl-CoA hydratase [Deltaproteobacteria bacterium]
MSDEVLKVEHECEGALAILTLNRPDAMNALSSELRAALSGAFAALEADPHTRVVILTGSGRAFCAGLDLKELGDPGGPGAGLDSGGDLVRAIERFPGPVIGAINGFAITGGFELALACDVLLASSEARFADTHARVGIMPGWGLSQKLSRALGIYRAKEISLTGNFVSAEQALEWGLVSHVTPAGELLDRARAIAGDMLSCVPEVLRDYKRVIDEGFAATFGEGLALERRTAREHARTVPPETIAERRKGVMARGREQGG